MNIFQAIFLAILQGLTEYLPVSSSAHIRIFGSLIGCEDPGAAFTAIIQIGTELAVLLYFRRDIARILTHWFGCLFSKDVKGWERFGSRDKDAAMGWYIIIGTIPIVVMGVLFQNVIETKLRNLWVIVCTLAIFGVLLWWFDAKSPQRKRVDDKECDMNWKDALLFGIGQMLALVPGVSRSGGTITFGRAMGYTREASARVSFLMAIPAVLGAGILEAVKAVKNTGDGAFPGWGVTILATVIAFFVGYVVIIGFLRLVSTFSYKGFAIYRICLAAFVVILLIAGVLTPMSGATTA
ncbi:MAG: undecaprenyl-diphosphatase UppP [Bifidobacteriaceae bacterium]|nr:undecaprenyl-diphosphatase UppP [Bifidobacteriaceae bacterium]